VEQGMWLPINQKYNHFRTEILKLHSLPIVGPGNGGRQERKEQIISFSFLIDQLAAV
jgi:hypothetical protein